MNEQEVWINEAMICVGAVWTFEIGKYNGFKAAPIGRGYIEINKSDGA